MSRRFAKHVWVVAVLTAVSLCGHAQEKPFVMPLVPAANWRQVDSHPLPLSAISQYGGEPAVEREYGVTKLELRTYQMGKTRTQVVVEPAADANSAYGLLTFYQTPAMSPVKSIQLSTGDSRQTLMARGSHFIRFLRDDAPIRENDYHALLIFVGGTRPSASTLRDLPPSMPAKGLIPKSEKYLLGLEAAKRVLPSFRADLLGFEQGAEVQLARYQTAKGASTALSINYPTPQMARVRFGALVNLLGLNQDRGENSIYGKRRGSYVFLILDAPAAKDASALLDQFHVTQGVSWDQPYAPEKTFTIELVRMILAILLLTAMLIGACIVAGVLFFLSRRFAAKFFPNSQWGRTDEDQLIRLNLKT